MLQIIIGNLIAFVILIAVCGAYAYFTEPKYSPYVDDDHDYSCDEDC